MKHLPPSLGGSLNKKHIDVLTRTRDNLTGADGDPDSWCISLGLHLRRVNLIPPVVSLLHEDTIYLAHGLTRSEEIKAIAHEYFHHVFHAPVTAYRHLDIFTINRHERESNLFAAELVKMYGDTQTPDGEIPSRLLLP